MTTDTRRYTGTWNDDGTIDCSAGLTQCEYEEDQDCFHCQHPVREHINEDGSYILTEPMEPKG